MTAFDPAALDQYMKAHPEQQWVYPTQYQGGANPMGLLYQKNPYFGQSAGQSITGNPSALPAPSLNAALSGGSPTMDYNSFVQQYVNTINPATGMYWQTADIPGFNPQMQGYIDKARDLNYQAVMAGKQPLTNAQLMMPGPAAPTQDMRQGAAAGGPMTLSSVLAAPRANPTMPAESSPMPRTTLPYSPPQQNYNTLSGLFSRQRSSGYMR